MNLRNTIIGLCVLVSAVAGDPGFVTTRGTDFIIDGRTFRFAGANNYYLHYKDHAMIDDVLENAAVMGLQVIRCWGYLDGNSHDGMVIQPEMGQFHEEGLERLDYALARADQLGLKMIVAMTNCWEDFGGMIQYVRWVKGPDAVNHADRDLFYTDSRVREAYRNYVTFMLNHVNPYTGVVYKEDPAIFAWELANEPRCRSDRTGDMLVGWADEMSAFIKDLDANHLVCVGDEGFMARSGHDDWTRNGYDGVDWQRLIALPAIDFGTVHLYPDSWNKTVQWGNDWIAEHVQVCHEIEKPVIIEEYGIRENKIAVYAEWTRLMESQGANGTLFWILTGVDTDSAMTLYGDFDGFRVVHPGPVSAVLRDHASRMNDLSEFKPRTAWVPAAPGNLKGSIRNGRVSLVWTDNALNENGFVILEGMPGFERIIGRRPAGSNSWEGPADSDSLVFTVKAFNGAGFSMQPESVIINRVEN